MAKSRLDQMMVDRGLAASRNLAQAYILEGKVMLNGKKVQKAGTQVKEDAVITVDSKRQWASRGSHKLLGALDAFPEFKTRIQGALCLDIGASTGGFTDVLLEHGAAKVIALDVGYGQLRERLRTHQDVIVMDRTNIRTLEEGSLPYAPNLVVCDASFISVTYFLDVVYREMPEEGDFLVLVKPQFEIGKERVGKGGVVRDDALRKEALEKVSLAAKELGFQVKGVDESPLSGPAGNREWLLWLQKSREDLVSVESIG